MTLLGFRQHSPMEHETLQHVDRLAPRATPLHVAKRLRRRSHSPSVVVVATAAAIAATTVAATTGVVTVGRYARGQPVLVQLVQARRAQVYDRRRLGRWWVMPPLPL